MTGDGGIQTQRSNAINLAAIHAAKAAYDDARAALVRADARVTAARASDDAAYNRYIAERNPASRAAASRAAAVLADARTAASRAACEADGARARIAAAYDGYLAECKAAARDAFDALKHRTTLRQRLDGCRAGL